MERGGKQQIRSIKHEDRLSHGGSQCFLLQFSFFFFLNWVFMFFSLFKGIRKESIISLHHLWIAACNKRIPGFYRKKRCLRSPNVNFTCCDSFPKKVSIFNELYLIWKYLYGLLQEQKQNLITQERKLSLASPLHFVGYLTAHRWSFLPGSKHSRYFHNSGLVPEVHDFLNTESLNSKEVRKEL